RRCWPDKRDACFKYVHHDGIDKEGLLAESRAWSHGEQVLVKIALDLFDPGCVVSAGHPPAGWGEVAYLLDRENMAIVLTALRIARQELRIAEIAELEDGHLEVSIIPGPLRNG